MDEVVVVVVLDEVVVVTGGGGAEPPLPEHALTVLSGKTKFNHETACVERVDALALQSPLAVLAGTDSVQYLALIERIVSQVYTFARYLLNYLPNISIDSQN